MNKPKIKKVEYMDYSECCDYLEKKFGYEERNYKKHRYDLADGHPDNPPYCDFWHWVCDRFNISNGSSFSFSNDSLDSVEEDWQSEILEHYLAEFGEGPNREVNLIASW